MEVARRIVNTYTCEYTVVFLSTLGNVPLMSADGTFLQCEDQSATFSATVLGLHPGTLPIMDSAYYGYTELEGAAAIAPGADGLIRATLKGLKEGARVGAVYLGELRGHGGLPQQILRERRHEPLVVDGVLRRLCC